MSWFTEGYEAAEQMSAGARGKSKNFFTRSKEEVAIVRFLKPSKDSFNYKRGYIARVQGQKMFTSPGSLPDPVLEELQASKGTLQSTCAWPILDRRDLELREGGVDKGPRILYFTDGRQTQKALVALEQQVLDDINEERKEEGKPALQLKDHNLTHYDIKLQKAEKGWLIHAVRGGKAKPLSAADQQVVRDNPITLEDELAPLPIETLRAIFGSSPSTEKDTTPSYSYGEDEEETSFFEKSVR